MEFQSLIISFLALMFVVCGVIIFGLKRTLISSTEGAVKRLDEEIQSANKRQAELSEKIREADEDLKRRQMEAKELSDKMRSDAEEESKAEREKIIGKARQEGEEIIAKAQGAKEKLRVELEKEFDGKIVNVGIEILNSVLSEKTKGALDELLIEEFVVKLSEVDMSRITPDVVAADVITLNTLNETYKNRLTQIVKEKLGRDISLKASTDAKIGGGVILKFGSMSLDGSVQNLIREVGITKQAEIDAR